ncbi:MULTISPECIES: hypothetical protein [Leptolyngbya]|uniref:hypothetical protein n=1 Tax=Leptolyngbya TaxID=47251 RepID=UPI0018EFFF87|nr:hypothetical protein [Leptolyngbya sp. FACHB-1624]
MVNPKTNGNGTSNGSSTSAQSIPAASPTFLSNPPNASKPEPLSQNDRDVIIRLLTQIREILPELRDLTAEERRSMLGMGDKNRIFAGKVLEVILQSPDFLPRSFDIEQYQQDLATFDRLSTILMALTQLRDLVDATTIALGSEIYEDALTAYRHAKVSGQGASLDSMMSEMAQRFARKSKKKEEEKSEDKTPESKE